MTFADPPASLNPRPRAGTPHCSLHTRHIGSGHVTHRTQSSTQNPMCGFHVGDAPPGRSRDRTPRHPPTNGTTRDYTRHFRALGCALAHRPRSRIADANSGARDDPAAAPAAGVGTLWLYTSRLIKALGQDYCRRPVLNTDGRTDLVQCYYVRPTRLVQKRRSRAHAFAGTCKGFYFARTNARRFPCRRFFRFLPPTAQFPWRRNTD